MPPSAWKIRPDWCPWSGAPHWSRTQQHLFYHICCNGSAVDCHKRAGRSLPCIMDPLCEPAFFGSALPVQDQVPTKLRCPAAPVRDIPHHCTLVLHILEPESRRKRTGVTLHHGRPRASQLILQHRDLIVQFLDHPPILHDIEGAQQAAVSRNRVGIGYQPYTFPIPAPLPVGKASSPPRTTSAILPIPAQR